MINVIQITRDELKRVTKELKADGWQSAHYFTRRGVNVDRLRNMAKKGEIGAKVLNIEGFQTSWYYRESTVNALREKSLI
jgi:hypothetical protein